MGLSRLDALLLLMTVIWGTNYAIVKHGFIDIDPQAFNALRMIVASSTFAAVMAWMHWRARARAAAGVAASAAVTTVFHSSAAVTGRDWRTNRLPGSSSPRASAHSMSCAEPK